MASTLNSTDTGSGGLITTGDSSDELQLQTAETTAITITSGQQSAFIAGTASAPAVTTTGDLNTGVFFPAADNIGFATNGVIRGRWTTDGLCFGSDTAAANALDDYEEGVWTPAFTFQTPGNLTQSLNSEVSTAFYTKIGRVVTLTFMWRATNFDHTTASGNFLITGLPFTVLNYAQLGGGAAGSITFFAIYGNDVNIVRGSPIRNTTQISIIYDDGSNELASVTATQVTTGNPVDFRGTITYITAT